MANDVRRKILRLLRWKNLTASEIANAFDISKPSISRHLDILKKAELVSCKRQGQFMIYSLNMITSIENVIPKTIAGVVCLLLLGATCIYCSKLDFKAICRSSIAVNFIVIISIALMIYGITYSMDISNTSNYNDRYNIFYYATSDFAKNVDLIFLILLVDTSYSKKQAFKYLGFKLLILEGISFIGLCVLGGTSIVSKYPFIDLGAYSQPFGIQRADGLYILISTLVTVLNISLALNISSRLLQNVLGKHKEILLTIAMIVTSYFINSFNMTIYKVRCNYHSYS